MISKKMADALNEQINREMFSSYLYLAMSAHCEHEGLAGAALWLGIQAKEEHGHAMKFYKYLLEQGARVDLQAIEKPAGKWESLGALFGAVLKHEQFITRSIHGLVDAAIAGKDHATQIMLQWFVTEQVEEEAHASEIVAKLKMVGSDARGLYLMDRELGSRAAS
jgi:ferritin